MWFDYMELLAIGAVRRRMRAEVTTRGLGRIIRLFMTNPPSEIPPNIIENI